LIHSASARPLRERHQGRAEPAALGRETAPVKAKVRAFWGVVHEEIAGTRLLPPFLRR